MKAQDYDKKIVLFAILFLKMNADINVLNDLLHYIDAPGEAQPELVDQFKAYLQELYDIMLSTMTGQNDSSVVH